MYQDTLCMPFFIHKTTCLSRQCWTILMWTHIQAPTHTHTHTPPITQCALGAGQRRPSIDWVQDRRRKRRKEPQAMSSRGGEDLLEISAPRVFVPHMDKTHCQTAASPSHSERENLTSPSLHWYHIHFREIIFRNVASKNTQIQLQTSGTIIKQASRVFIILFTGLLTIVILILTLVEVDYHMLNLTFY